MARSKKTKLATFTVSIYDDCEVSGERIIYSFSAPEDHFGVPAADRDWLLREAGWDETCSYEPTLMVRRA